MHDDGGAERRLPPVSWLGLKIAPSLLIAAGSLRMRAEREAAHHKTQEANDLHNDSTY